MKFLRSAKYWALVELMGHQKTAGQIEEITLAGQEFLLLHVPAGKNSQAFSKILGPGSIWGITPVSEEQARAAVNVWAPLPMEKYCLEEIAREMAVRMVSRERVIEPDEPDDDDCPF